MQLTVQKIVKREKRVILKDGIYSKSKKLIGLLRGKQSIMINRFFTKGYRTEGCKKYLIVANEAELEAHFS